MDIWKIFENFADNIWTIDRQCFSFTICLLHSIEIEFMNGHGHMFGQNWYNSWEMSCQKLVDIWTILIKHLDSAFKALALNCLQIPYIFSIHTAKIMSNFTKYCIDII